MNRFNAYSVLIALGAGWGLTQPLAKIAVSGTYRHFGLIFWQFAISAAFLGIILLILRKSVSLNRSALRFYVIIALIGTLLPNSASYEAARFLPSGIMSIVISMVPMFAFPIALAMGTDRFSVLKLAGLLLGMFGVVLMVAPETSLPSPAMAAFIPLALIAPAFYGLEGNVVAKWGTFGCEPIEVLFGSSVMGMFLSIPFAWATDSWITPAFPLTIHDYALIASSVIHASVYTGYVWLIGRAGSVFAAQCGYLVTGFGIVWAMLILGERYSPWVWLALAIVLAGVALVQPRKARKSLEAAA